MSEYKTLEDIKRVWDDDTESYLDNFASIKELREVAIKLYNQSKESRKNTVFGSSAYFYEKGRMDFLAEFFNLTITEVGND